MTRDRDKENEREEESLPHIGSSADATIIPFPVSCGSPKSLPQARWQAWTSEVEIFENSLHYHAANTSHCVTQ